MKTILLELIRHQVKSTQIDQSNLTLGPAALQSQLPTSFRVP